MGGTGILSGVILVCLAVLVLAALAKPLRVLLRFGLSAAAGAAVLALCHGFGLSVGANVVTVVLVGLLGTPGFLGLLALSLIL
ncbi:pro-sigmaK processing inhibitor BofA family protein [Anaerotignum lactatifermentans]|uniref:Pro-sigmaK processing inhibitor BofA family protein n=1 Tax=Anaerotignum lactatifermentans TaxID=160404 RepID=A0ABS2GBL5_9FIRM|nr:pro-sigmaK processing inhibitor BofA family protein [Anaerotignum lactatifermentans]MBM6829927.1 pro-sigmaK processing inhibitor BofA family protein [Anaerotignum lactatifermentans]MBM6878430.1 pro-sigmaK processing inhibitor BofA family protein [Anaerotignum lactatifermentans]MBM6951648.1 pro-sigmaK processing inhibitor BofA family protein [Anaerotignum lactatifermentans]